MVLFTITTQIIDTLILKGTYFIANQTLNVLSWGGNTIYTYYIPPPPSKQELLENKVNILEHKLKLLSDDFIDEYVIINTNDYIENDKIDNTTINNS